MLSERDLDFLRRLSVFAGLPEEVLAKIGKHARRLDIDSDGVLYREGEPAKEMAVVLEGTLEVVKKSDTGSEVRIATLGPGNVAGEMSLIDIQPRSADVWACGPVALAILQHSDLASLYREDKRSYTLLVLNIAREISIRLRRVDTALANVLGHIQEVTNVRVVGSGAPDGASEREDREGTDSRGK